MTNNQSPNSLVIGVWSLMIIWCLEFGDWLLSLAEPFSDHPHLGLQQHIERSPHPALNVLHEREDVVAARAAEVHDEVRMPRGHLRVADPRALETRLVD